MTDYILLMHSDTQGPEREDDWDAYIGGLIASGCFQGGSSFGVGHTFRISGTAAPPSEGLVGYIKIKADDLDSARAALSGNPTYEAGGTVEIRPLVAG